MISFAKALLICAGVTITSPSIIHKETQTQVCIYRAPINEYSTTNRGTIARNINEIKKRFFKGKTNQQKNNTAYGILILEAFQKPNTPKKTR